MANAHSHDSHSPSAEGLPSYDDINTPVVVMVGVISALLTLLSMMFFEGLYYHWEERFQITPDIVKSSAAEQIENQKQILKGNGSVKPIDEAMQAVVTQFRQ